MKSGPIATSVALAGFFSLLLQSFPLHHDVIPALDKALEPTQAQDLTIALALQDLHTRAPILGYCQQASPPSRAFRGFARPVEMDSQVTEDNPYGEMFRRLLYGRSANVESIRRRLALRRIGPALERFARWVLRDHSVSLVIAPLGSALKGYSGRNSDVEFRVSLLRGPPKVAPEHSDKIIDKGVRLLRKEGFVGEPAMRSISHVVSFAIAAEERSRFFVPDDSLAMTFYDGAPWEFLFLPATYTSPVLLETARRNVVLFLLDSDLSDDVWPTLFADYMPQIRINLDFGKTRDRRVRRWLRRLNAWRGGAVNNDALEAHYATLALPRFEQMVDIYRTPPSRAPLRAA